MKTLEDYLGAAGSAGSDIAPTIAALAAAARRVHTAIQSGRVSAQVRGATGSNASGETQKPLDVFADETFYQAAQVAPVTLYGSEEQDAPVACGGGTLAIAIDPLDGSSNIETNIAVGTIFSLFPVTPGAPLESAFLKPGTEQCAAGFFVYGAQLLFVLTLGNGTHAFIYDPDRAVFMHLARCEIATEAREYSINAANRRHWFDGMAAYVADLEAGAHGSRRRDFTMRYTGSLVADGYRILQRGGVFAYPADRREGYGRGRLRQLYEANPMAFCIEQAGGGATDGVNRLLELPSAELHAKVPFIFGARDEVERIAGYLAATPSANS